ncbi:MAG: hypothetical protein WCB51_08790 [Candidatus Dormiibacterota bacterium]
MLRPLAVVVLVAAVVMFGALFLPFVRQGCIFCPISGPGYTFQLPTFSLMQGLDGWIVLCVVVAMGLAAIAHLRDAMRISAIACLLLSLAALGLCVFEGVDSAGRVVGLDASPQPIQLGVGPPAHSINPPAYWNYGLYVFFSAALVAVLASVALVLLTQRTKPQSADRIAFPIPAP